MSTVNKPIMLDETGQLIASQLSRISSMTGKSAYESAVDGGYGGTEDQFNRDLAGVSGIIQTINIAQDAIDDALEEMGALQTAVEAAKDAGESARDAASAIAGFDAMTDSDANSIIEEYGRG